jgi:hypothetical protein
MMIERLKEALEPLKKELTQHPLYENIDTIECLKTFMEYHVYAVWDFMSLVKKLQIDLTSTNLPWVPPKNNSAARFINEIVWGEETDLDENGTAVSHFEMYINAMQQINANTLGIEETLEDLQLGRPILEIIVDKKLPQAVSDFLRFTFQTIEEGKTHNIAAVFTFGREDLIPDMFLSMIKKMNREQEQNFSQIIYYFERHIEVDGDTHGPLAEKMINTLCGEDPAKWNEALNAAREALKFRLALWEAINSRIVLQKTLIS